jgi:hypothetical protein
VNVDLEPQLEVGEKSGGHNRLAILLIGCVLVMGAVGIILWNGHGQSSVAGSARQLPFGPVEQGYAPQIHFTDIQMSRGENFLNQQVTNIAGVAANDGPRRIQALDVSVDFREFSGKVVLHETRRLLGNREAPFQAGQSRNFQLSFESVPDSWNQYYPDLKVTGLALE